jgi:hypothetical protein
MRRAVLALLLTGCSYDWASATSSADAAHDAPPIDATAFDGSDAAPVDVVTESAVDASTNTGDADASPQDVDAAECQQLLQKAKSDLTPALVCTPSVSACQAKTDDWCNCTIYLGDGTSPAYMTFAADVAAFVSAGCRSILNCAPCLDASAGVCIVSDAAGNYACYL